MSLSETDGQIVTIRGATKRFTAPEGGRVTALDNLSLDVRNNEFITLLGPSGCGKTTLLRCISGFEDLDSGDIFVDGRPMHGVPPHRRPVNTVFQNYALFPHLSVGDNVGYSLDVARIPKAERNRRVAEALELVNLGGLERRRPAQLSGGQQQRVALARAVVSRPKLLLLDEPLSALDRNLRRAMQLELKTLQHELGISFVFVTHDQEEALTMSDQIVVLDSGRVQQIGSPTEIYDRPINSFVARFVGESNMFHGRAIAAPGGCWDIETSEGPRLRVKAAGSASPPGEPVSILIRPEQLRIVEGDADNAGTGVVEGVLSQAVFVGTDYQLIARLPGGFEVRAVIRDVSRRSGARYRPGDPVRFAYDIDTPHIIRDESGGA